MNRLPDIENKTNKIIKEFRSFNLDDLKDKIKQVFNLIETKCDT
jgi:hypothetical protein